MADPFDLEETARKIQNAIARMRAALGELNTELVACHREIQEALGDKTPVARSKSQLLAAARESAKKAGEILEKATSDLDRPSRPSQRPPRGR